MAWDFRRFGTEADPIRQSAINALASQNGCARRYRFERDAELAGTRPPPRAHWRPCLGTAVHAVIERSLTRAWPQLEQVYGPGSTTRPLDAPPGWAPASLRNRVDEVLREELSKAAGIDETTKQQRPIEWYDASPETEIAAGVAMVIGAIRTTVERADSIVACEAPFRAQLDEYHLEGTIDLVYRRRGDLAVCFNDWKTGERKLPQVVIDFGYQASTYAHAIEHGVLFPGVEGRELRVGVMPAELHIVHLRDFVPYVKKPRTAGKGIGDLRGPGWYASQRTSSDVARLRVSLKVVVGTVRMGRFVEQLGEQCGRCPFRGPCLTDGHVTAGDQRRLAAALEGVDVGDGGLGDIGANEAA